MLTTSFLKKKILMSLVMKLVLSFGFNDTWLIII